MPTLRRSILNLLTTLNIRVRDLEPGSALISRRHDYTVTPLGRGRWMVGRGRGARPHALAALLDERPEAQWKEVPLGPGSVLFTDRKQSTKEEQQTHKAAQEHLGAEHVASLLTHYRVNCVLDVGGNIGQYGTRLRQYGYTGRIASFEPVAATAKKLRAAAADDPEWYVYPYALGREDRTDTINVVYGSMSSLLDPSDFGTSRYKRFRKSKEEQITVRRLDGLLDEVFDGLDDPRPYLKLDTQGFDLEAYAGCGDHIGRFVGLQSEVALLQIYEGMPRMGEAIATYEADGFEVTGMYPVTREESTGRVLEFDCVMVRAQTLPEETER